MANKCKECIFLTNQPAKRIRELTQLVMDMYGILKHEDIDGRMFMRNGKVVFECWEDRLHELGIEVNQ